MTTAGYLTISRKCHPERYASSPDAIRQVEAAAAMELDAFFAMMDGAIAGKPHFLKHGYSVLEVADRLGVTSKSLYDWIKKYGDQGEQHKTISSQQDELKRLNAELRRVTEERDILKEAAAYFAGESRKSTRS